ncbi:MAG: hypothetical protein WDN48_00420 [Pseudolabrys sp.]
MARFQVGHDFRRNAAPGAVFSRILDHLNFRCGKRIEQAAGFLGIGLALAGNLDRGGLLLRVIAQFHEGLHAGWRFLLRCRYWLELGQSLAGGKQHHAHGNR